MAQNQSETAQAKKQALREVGVTVVDVFEDLSSEVIKNNEGKHMAQNINRYKIDTKALYSAVYLGTLTAMCMYLIRIYSYL